MKRTILYIGWVGFGNYGDDLCRDLFLSRMTTATKDHGIELEVRSIFPSTNFDERDLLRIRPDLVVLGAGSLFEPIYLRPLVYAGQKSIPTVIWGSGVDLLSETLDPLAISPDTAYMIRQVVNNSRLVGVRGPRTLEILHGLGCAHPTLHISGDPGLLFAEDPAEQEFSRHRPVLSSVPATIGVNWGTALNRVFGGNEQLAQRQLAEALRELTNRYKVIIYPIWERDTSHCQRLADQVGASNQLACLNLPTVAELKNLYSQCLFTINLKLHANVFSASFNCPFIPLAYRSKTLDFAESMEYDDLTIPLSSKELTANLLTNLDILSSQLPLYRQRLKDNKTRYAKNLALLEQEMLAIMVN